MNRAAAALKIDEEPMVQTAEIDIAGVSAVCDPLGALYLPGSATPGRVRPASGKGCGSRQTRRFFAALRHRAHVAAS